MSLDDIKRVAKRLIEADRLITTIVGKPVDGKAEGRRRARGSTHAAVAIRRRLP